MRFIFSQTIWAPGAIPADEWKFRNLKRIMFPIVDMFFLFAGLSAAINGLPAINQIFPSFVVGTFSYLLMGSAFLCFIGVSFPRLWPIEITGLSILLGLMVGFFLSVSLVDPSGEENKGFALFITGIAICPVVWRFTLLGSEWQQRRVDRAGE